MVTKRIRSEYMNKFKDPKWETYTKCYVEMVEYRLSRRLLEHAHNPWIWFGSEIETDSGGRSPTPPSNNQVGAEISSHRTELEECDGARVVRLLEQQTRRTVPVSRLPLREKQQENVTVVQPSATQGPESNGTMVKKASQKGDMNQRVSIGGSKNLKDPQGDKENVVQEARSEQKKTSKSKKQTRQSQQVKPAPIQQSKEESSTKHPFAMYGSGEKDASISGKKTHNVLPAASTNEIHESALRAKTRREVERQVQTKQTEEGGAKFTDVDRVRKRVQTSFNPWLTEYMRCFSAHSLKDSNARTIHNKSQTSKPTPPLNMDLKNTKIREWGCV